MRNFNDSYKTGGNEPSQQQSQPVGWVSTRFGRIQADANINSIPVVG